MDDDDATTPVPDLLADPAQTWVIQRARRTKACLLSVTVALGLGLDAIALACAIYLLGVV